MWLTAAADSDKERYLLSLPVLSCSTAGTVLCSTASTVHATAQRTALVDER